MIIDGKTIAKEILDSLQKEVSSIAGNKPTLVFIIVGNDPASHIYVRKKKESCNFLGFHSEVIAFPETVEEKELLSTIRDLNDQKDIDGILVQLPLPPHIRTREIIYAIAPSKDVDGFHPINVGKLLLGEEDGLFSCTPLGIITLLEKSNIETSGKHVVIVGRSNIVGKPLAALLVQKYKGGNATVTIAHSLTRNLSSITKQADILIAAIGKPKFITKDMVKKGAVVIDVGMSRLPNKKLSGDVDFEEVRQIASHITPVPGGVGPMTIAMLMTNTWKSFCSRS